MLQIIFWQLPGLRIPRRVVRAAIVCPKACTIYNTYILNSMAFHAVLSSHNVFNERLCVPQSHMVTLVA